MKLQPFSKGSLSSCLPGRSGYAYSKGCMYPCRLPLQRRALGGDSGGSLGETHACASRNGTMRRNEPCFEDARSCGRHGRPYARRRICVSSFLAGRQAFPPFFVSSPLRFQAFCSSARIAPSLTCPPLPFPSTLTLTLTLFGVAGPWHLHVCVVIPASSFSGLLFPLPARRRAWRVPLAAPRTLSRRVVSCAKFDNVCVVAGCGWHLSPPVFPQIDSALLAIALDDHGTPDLQAECRAFLAGDSGRNRWFDRHQLVRTYSCMNVLSAPLLAAAAAVVGRPAGRRVITPRNIPAASQCFVFCCM